MSATTSTRAAAQNRGDPSFSPWRFRRNRALVSASRSKSSMVYSRGTPWYFRNPSSSYTRRDVQEGAELKAVIRFIRYASMARASNAALDRILPLLSESLNKVVRNIQGESSPCQYRVSACRRTKRQAAAIHNCKERRLRARAAPPHGEKPPPSAGAGRWRRFVHSRWGPTAPWPCVPSSAPGRRTNRHRGDDGRVSVSP